MDACKDGVPSHGVQGICAGVPLGNGLNPHHGSVQSASVSVEPARRVVLRRKHFEKEQISQLDNYFLTCQYPDYAQRVELAKMLGLGDEDKDEKRVQVWFKNRRAKGLRSTQGEKKSSNNRGTSSNRGSPQQSDRQNSRAISPTISDAETSQLPQASVPVQKGMLNPDCCLPPGRGFILQDFADGRQKIVTYEISDVTAAVSGSSGTMHKSTVDRPISSLCIASTFREWSFQPDRIPAVTYFSDSALIMPSEVKSLPSEPKKYTIFQCSSNATSSYHK